MVRVKIHSFRKNVTQVGRSSTGAEEQEGIANPQREGGEKKSPEGNLKRGNTLPADLRRGGGS